MVDVSRVKFPSPAPDFLENLALSGGPYTRAAYRLQAIEDASEQVRKILQKDSVFERILGSLGVPYTLCETTIPNINKIRPTTARVSVVSLELTDGGHFTCGVADDTHVYIYDSMCSPCGAHNDYKYFKAAFKKLYPTKTVKHVKKDAFYQPSGGFCVGTKTNLRKVLTKTFNKKFTNMDLMFLTHQFDVVSQHHFCYVEVFVFLSHMLFGTTMGPENDLEKRLIFIKRVAFGLIKRFTNSNFKDPNFEYIMTVTNSTINKGFTIPTQKSRFVVKHFVMPMYTNTTSLPNIIISAETGRAQNITPKKLSFNS